MPIYHKFMTLKNVWYTKAISLLPLSIFVFIRCLCFCLCLWSVFMRLSLAASICISTLTILLRIAGLRTSDIHVHIKGTWIFIQSRTIIISELKFDKHVSRYLLDYVFSNPPGKESKIFENKENTFILPHRSDSEIVEILWIPIDVYVGEIVKKN